MKLIKHMIFADLDGGKKLLLNSLNGRMEEINSSVYKILSDWIECEELSPKGESEKKLYNNLKDKGYVVSNDEEEKKRKEAILVKLRKRHLADREKFRVMNFVLTYDCNYRCTYCFEREARVRSDVMTTELVDAALSLSNDSLEVIGLFGGEPLLPKTRPIIEYLISKMPDKLYDITTNGYYLENFLDLFASVAIDRITVTIDGDEETHDSRRYLANGKPTFQVIMGGIAKYIENGLPISIRMNVNADNIDECNLLKQHLLEKFNYNDLLQCVVAPIFQGTHDENNQLVHSMYESEIELAHNGKIDNGELRYTMNPIVNAFTTSRTMSPIYSYCYAHENKVAVDPYGNIFTCLACVGNDELATGKYYPEVEFKENSIYNRNIDKIPECRDCIYSLLCGGGCATRLPDYCDWFKPQCSNVKNEIYNLLPKLYKIKKQAAYDNNLS